VSGREVDSRGPDRNLSPHLIPPSISISLLEPVGSTLGSFSDVEIHTRQLTPAMHLASQISDPRSHFRPGNVNATNPVCSPCPVAKTMYCFPLYRNVIGTAVLTVGIGTAPTCLPVALSKA
jgi:hypothetical protein